ncbi:MAG: hypothetical protein FWC40_08905, partial [Proteobacteria bacterium]|nr:hypothetical protein [Pseudomonadota bacterium]
MSQIPETIRFHYARQAPSSWNWYTQSDFAGCLLRWSAPEGFVVRYVIFRSCESLPSNACEDLLDGYHDDTVDRIDVFKPITALVDDEIHEKNRYLVLARLDNEDWVWIDNVESERFTGGKSDEVLTYWSNPYEDKPKIKDPCRLDYLSIRVGTFCGFEWDYPDDYPDFVGYDLIVNDVPISPHTGAESDIAAFKAVLSGQRGTTYPLERFIHAIVDNETLANRFWYYALLVRLPEGGRVQIPLRHVSEPFAKGRPFQYLKARQGWGEGRDKMMASYAHWKANEQKRLAQAEAHSNLPLPARAPGIALSFFRHAPDLSLASYIDHPAMVGIQFSAKVANGKRIVAIRAKSDLSASEINDILRRALEDTVVESEDFDAFAFCPNKGHMILVDADCHEKPNYAFAVYEDEDDDFVELSHVKDVTTDFLANFDATILWGNRDFSCTNRLVHCLVCEAIPKKNALSLEFGAVDESIVKRIEVYHFYKPIDWANADDETIEALHEFQRTGHSELGERFVLPKWYDGVVDNVTEVNTTHQFAALIVDKYDNRHILQLFSIGSIEREDWPVLSEFCELPAAVPASVVAPADDVPSFDDDVPPPP